MQSPQAEHLWRLRQPFVFACHGAGHSGSTVVDRLRLQGVRQRQGQQAAYRVIPAGLDQCGHRIGRDEATRGIVHQHPIQCGHARRQHGTQAIEHALGAVGTATGMASEMHRPCGLGPFKIVTCGQDHPTAGQLGHPGQRLQGVHDHGLPRHVLVLLGLWGTCTAALARTGHQDMKKRICRGRRHGQGL